MDNVEFKWTDGTDKTFHKFYLRTENYYSSIVGGEENRNERSSAGREYKECRNRQCIGLLFLFTEEL